MDEHRKESPATAGKEAGAGVMRGGEGCSGPGVNPARLIGRCPRRLDAHVMRRAGAPKTSDLLPADANPHMVPVTRVYFPRRRCIEKAPAPVPVVGRLRRLVGRGAGVGINRQRIVMRYRLSTAGVGRQCGCVDDPAEGQPATPAANVAPMVKPRLFAIESISPVFSDGPARAFFFMVHSLVRMPQTRRGPVVTNAAIAGDGEFEIHPCTSKSSNESPPSSVSTDQMATAQTMTARMTAAMSGVVMPHSEARSVVRRRCRAAGHDATPSRQ